MRSLFIKIFVWFWLAMILVAGAAVVSLHAYLDPREEGLRAMARHLKNPAGYVAVEILEENGPAALRQHLERWSRHAGFRGFVFDGQGAEVSGQDVPPEAVEAAERVRETGEGTMRRSATLMFVASRVPGPSGKRYIFVAGLPPRPPSGEDGGPFAGGPLGFLLAQPRILVLILAAVVLMSGIVCYGLARYLTGPLRRLRTSARKLADGDLAVRVGAAVQNRRDEMGDLGRDFDFMAEQIESLVLAQRRLLRDMSHELRSPLARLNVALGLIRQRTGPEVSSDLDRIEREAQRLNELIGHLLMLARLEEGPKAGEEMGIDLAALVREVVADAEFEARGCNREVGLLRCDECTATGRHELLRSAIENVVRNGIRYTAEGTQVDVSLVCGQPSGESRATVTVRDHGPGVADGSIEEMFRPFYRVGDDRDRQSGGVGLGLAIAQRAVRLHGGAISAVNAPDGGLLVGISLPATRGTA